MDMTEVSIGSRTGTPEQNRSEEVLINANIIFSKCSHNRKSTMKSLSHMMCVATPKVGN